MDHILAAVEVEMDRSKPRKDLVISLLESAVKLSTSPERLAKV